LAKNSSAVLLAVPLMSLCPNCATLPVILVAAWGDRDGVHLLGRTGRALF
jgi:hypothetical protein